MSDTWDRIDAELRESGLSGVVAVHRGGIAEFEGAYGLANRADGVPVTPRTRFALASVSKMFTAAAVATLIRDGRVALGTPVVDVLPPERRPSTLRPDVTVGDLLGHTSGIADYAEEDGDDELDYAALWDDRPVHRMLRPADFLPMFGDLPPYRAPGGPCRYSNAGYVVLALLVEELTGLEFPAAVGERVFGPAGMDASGYFRTDDVRPDVAVGYVAAEGGGFRTTVFSVPVIGGGDGGAHSTAADLDRFLRAWDDGSLFGRELRDELLAPRREVEPGVACGYGAFLFDGCFGHDGEDPGTAAIVQRDPAADLSVSVLCNVAVPVLAARTRVVAAARAATA